MGGVREPRNSTATTACGSSSPLQILWSGATAGKYIFQLTTTQVFAGTGRAITAPVNSDFLIFVDSDNNLRWINADGSDEDVIDDAGDWHSIALSPDGSRLVATTTYDEPVIWYLDFESDENWRQIWLYQPTTQEGIHQDIARYADVLQWDATGTHVIYDVFNSLPGPSGETIDFWTVNVLEPTSPTIWPRFPPQPEGVQISSPSLSSAIRPDGTIDDCRLLYERLDDLNELTEVRVMDFCTGEEGVLSTLAGPVFTFPGFINGDREVVFEWWTVEEGVDTSHLWRQPLTDGGFSSLGEPLLFVPNSRSSLTFILASAASSEVMPPHPQTLSRVPGRNQQGAAGTALARPFEVLVLDQNGDPLPGATVTFAVTAGGGTLSATTATTDADGHAATILTLGPQPGTNTVEAVVTGLEPVTFTALGVAVPRALTKLSGDEQVSEAGAALGQPLVVEVRDQNGNPLPGATITFAITAGGGTLSATTVPTNADGRASTKLTLGRFPGTYTVRATVVGLQPVTFTITAKASPDFDGDGETGFSDFFLFADAFGGSDPRFDLDGSGSVDFGDFFLLADHFADPARGKLLELAQEMIGLPDAPQLQQNAPNPFNSETVFSWFVLRPGPVRLEVYALTGQRVTVLHRGPIKAGGHRVHWDGRDNEGRPLASGVYLYQLVTDQSVQTRKLTLLR